MPLYTPDKCPSSHWNNGSDVCEDCGLDLNETQPEEVTMAEIKAEARLHLGLPVQGYKPQPEEAVTIVNEMKMTEERVLRMLDDLKVNPNVDQRWLQIGRTGIEQAFMAINRSVFQPGRIVLPEDTAHP